jgi:pimeloyl-ACP methyl ester carboxylesterase
MALAHDRTGAGEPLVLLHGLGHNLHAWDAVMDELGRERDVVALDMPGFGASPPLPAGTPPTVEALAESVEQTIGELGLERPHVAGNSLGGAVALELGRRGSVRSVTAIAPVGFWCSRRELAFASASVTLTRDFTRRLGWLIPLLAASRLGRTLAVGQVYGRPWRLPRESLIEDAELMAGAAGFDDARDHGLRWTFRDGIAPDIPITIAWGTRDRLLIPRQGRRAQRVLPRARMIWLEGCGHLPMWDDPPLVTRVLLEGSARR